MAIKEYIRIFRYMKDFFKIIILAVIVGLISMIGIWGVLTQNSDTEWGWQLWGFILANGVIAIPCAYFWMKQVAKVIDLEL